MDTFVSHLKDSLRDAFTSEEYSKKKAETLRVLEEKKKQLVTELNQTTEREGFSLEKSPIGTVLTPLLNGKLVNEAEFDQLPEDTKHLIIEKRAKLEGDMRSIFKKNHELDTKLTELVKALEKEVAVYALEPYFSRVTGSISQDEGVIVYLREVEEDILQNLREILSEEVNQQELTPMLAASKEDLLQRYRVNLIVDNSGIKHAPVVIELNPTYPHLFGYTEKETTVLSQRTIRKSKASRKSS
jgi:hypothetical protein